MSQTKTERIKELEKELRQLKLENRIGEHKNALIKPSHNGIHLMVHKRTNDRFDTYRTIRTGKVELPYRVNVLTCDKEFTKEKVQSLVDEIKQDLDNAVNEYFI